MNKKIFTFILIFLFLLFLLLIIIVYLIKKSNNNDLLKVSYLKNMIKITSPVFDNDQMIPEKYTCKGENISPPLIIKEVPSNAKSLVLIVDDPDAPMETFTHWLVWNIEPTVSEIKENSIPQGAVEGKNDFGSIGYGGPCPPSDTHRYYFKVLALDKILTLSSGANRNQLEEEIKNHILDKGELMGRFSQ